jgi:ABC-type multidrug transport system fused ATPase/permease subunit
MSKREAILSALVIFAVALAARVFFASQIVFPKPEDTAYYVAVARNLLDGRGLIFDGLWSYGTPPLEVPRAAFEVWLPLPTFLSAATMAVLGETFAAAQVSSIVIGAIVPVLAWRLAADVGQELELPVGRARTLAVGAGLTTAVYLPLVLHSALPDSTMPFTALALIAVILMERLLRNPRGARIWDPRLLALGVVLGLAALTRNEAIWLALVWAGMALSAGQFPRGDRIRLVGVAAVVAAVVFAPWALRNWQEFGSPLPSQTATNALSLTGLDIFAWNDPPTLRRYLDAGVEALIRMRVTGFLHNLLNVLVLLGLPLSVLGVLSIPFVWPSRSLRPLAWYSLITFFFTCLVFPVATTWGTFLHAAGPVHVWLVIGALLLLDALIARIGERRHWTRPVAWLGPTLAIFGSVLFSLVLLPGFGRSSIETRDYYAALGPAFSNAAVPLDDSIGPVISDFPIWLADTQGIRTLALPDEPPHDVFDLSRHFPGTRYVIVSEGDDHAHWPEDIDAGVGWSECFHEIDIGLPPTRVFEIVCR